MTQKEAIEYCHKHRDDYIRDFERIDEGIEAFDCLISCLESGDIKPEQLNEYGMGVENGKET